MEKIAIIGLSGLFPGSETSEQYWHNLIQEKDLTSLATAEQMGVDANIFYDSNKGKTDKYYCLRGGYIRDFNFDANGYQIDADLLLALDDSYKWSLYVSKQALKDSGYLENYPVLANCGVILGNLSFPTQSSHSLFSPIYHQIIDSALQKLLQTSSFKLEKKTSDRALLNGILSGYPSALISQALALSGVNFTLDAACASSLYAIKLACNYLLSGKADLMLAGAVSCADPFFINMGFSIFQAYSAEGRTRPLDRSSQGLVAGEGAGMVVLKRYDDAIRDGDRIYATITGIGLSNDGKGKFVLSPNPKGQILAFERAYADAGINPNQIDYIECHATGTPLGDITELNSMEAFFGQYQAKPLIGSVKSNFGHLLTAAGIAGLIKVILSMTKGVIPPTINLNQPLSSKNGIISADQIVNSLTPWSTQTQIKRAAISAFGFGGTNAHLILESTEAIETQVGSEDFNPLSLDNQQSDKRLTTNPDKNLNCLAIIGMDAVFGNCQGLDSFDRAIYEGTQHFIPLPPQRWQGIEESPQWLKNYGLINGQAPQGAYIKDFNLDFLRFKIPLRDEDRLIPQQLLMLKVADNAIKDAGLVEGANVAVIVAMGTEPTLHQFRGRVDLSWQIKESLEQANISLSPEKLAELETLVKDSLHPPAQVNQYTSFIGNIMACRISALWDFSGPSFTISAEENSVFKALEVAQLLLANNEVDAVVVGAVDLAGGFENVLLRTQVANVKTGINTLSYDVNAKGWMVGEGAGAIVLKQHEIALQEQDRIYAVIDAISLVQDNTKGEILKILPKTPSSIGITKTCQQAFDLVGIQPKEIGYLEVFASGITQEDEAEIKGLLQAYQLSNPQLSVEEAATNQLSCCLGSVKSNIGHTYAASGMASLIKTALCLYHRYIPATPQWSAPKMPELWQNSPFYVATKSRTWFLEPGMSKRVAAINGLGLDGSYSHLVLSEAINSKKRSSKYLKQTPLYLFPLVADNCPALLEQLNNLQNTLENCEALSIAAVQTYQAFQQAPPSTYKLAVVGHNRDELLKEIRFALPGVKKAFEQQGDWKTPLGSYFTANPLGKHSKIAFVYPGMGSADIELGHDIFRLFPNVYNTFSNLTTNVSQVLHEKLIYPRSLTQLSKEARAAKQEQFFSDGVAMCQSSISLAVLYTLILREYFQVHPQAAFGYSLGEASSMLFALGVWCDRYHAYASSSTEALASSPLFKSELCGSCIAGRKFLGLPLTESDRKNRFWVSYLLNASASTVKEALKQEEKVYLTFINTPQEVVISGDAQSCLKLIKRLKSRYFPINFDTVLHSEVAQSEYEELVKLHTIPIQNVPNIEFYSGVEVNRLSIDTHPLAQNSAQLCCQTVDFPRLVNRVYEDGVKIFIEVGAKNNCSQWISQILKNTEHLALSIHTKGVDDHTGIIKLLAKLVSHDVPVDLSSLYDCVEEASPQSKSLLKTVTLGGNSIHSAILNPENQGKFKNRGQHKQNSDRLGQKKDIKNMDSPYPSSKNPQQSLKIIQLQIAVSQTLLNQNLSVTNKKNCALKASSIILPAKSFNVIWNEADLLEFAEGNIASVFGQDYKIIDSYSRRVRLPLPPYLLVSRVTQLEAQPGQFKPSSLTTEYDIPFQAWYSVDGQVPWAITVESGQCDLLLISYLGIDFQNKGELVYRLLDCTLTFLDELPKEGDTLRYDIKINSFVKNGDNLLFFFSYECFVGENMILKMDGGCAGFFSDEQLEQGKGIIVSDKELAERRNLQKQTFEPLLICQKSTFSESDILHLSRGDIAACFGDHYCQYGLNPSLRLPPQQILMLDRVVSVDPIGGDWGLGLIIGEKQLEPDHWYFPCHFKGDRVLAGSLMAEGCGQLLQFYLLYLGLHTCTNDARFQPIPGLPQVVRCRGQVTPISAKLIYRMEVTEIGLIPKPYAKCNVDIILNGKTIVGFKDLGLQLSEKNPINSLSPRNQRNQLLRKEKQTRKPALLTEEQIQEFCIGSVAKCFGSEYIIYDNGTVKASRMPNSHLNLVHRVLEVKGQRHQLTKGSTIIAEYDTPLDPWYYRQNSSDTLPYSILMEIALQPCGFLSAYLGTTFLYPKEDLYFRNLDGWGHLIQTIDIRGKTVTTTATLLSSSNIQGMILQNFEFKVACEGDIFYQGEAAFGHFSPKALANQVGLDRGQDARPWYEEKNTLALPELEIDLQNLETRSKHYQTDFTKPYYRLAQYQLDLLHQVKIVKDGGRYQQGYIYARKEVKPSDWYFKCHFYLDPVMPGSLGVEAILQAMQVYALHLDLGKPFKSPRFVSVGDHKVVWKYRGQIPHGHTEMHLEVHVSKIIAKPEKVILIGDASLWKQNIRIYEVKDAAICLMDAV